MAYNPEDDRSPSPVEMGELFVATRELATAGGIVAIGNPDKIVPPGDMDNAYMDESFGRFYGLGVERGGPVPAIGEHVLASRPPTWRARYTDLSLLHQQIPDAAEVLGLGSRMDVLYHVPYVRYTGGESMPIMTRPVRSDCALFFPDPQVENIKSRIYKLTPNHLRDDYARGTRTDFDPQRGFMRNENGTMPEIRYTEWDRLMRVVSAARNLVSLEMSSRQLLPLESDFDDSGGPDSGTDGPQEQ